MWVHLDHISTVTNNMGVACNNHNEVDGHKKWMMGFDGKAQLCSTRTLKVSLQKDLHRIEEKFVNQIAQLQTYNVSMSPELR